MEEDNDRLKTIDNIEIFVFDIHIHLYKHLAINIRFTFLMSFV
jgi:hypothetical protein